MGPLAAPVPADVGLERVGLDHDRLPRLRFALFLLRILVRIARIGILDDQHETLAVGGPCIIGDSALDTGQFDRFAAGAIHEPDLRALRALPRREKRQELSVWTPARRRLTLR